MLDERSTDNVAALAKKCEDLLKGCVNGDFDVEDFALKLRALGITPEVAADYVQQLQQHLTQAGPKRSGDNWQDNDDEGNGDEDDTDAPERGRTPAGLTTEQVENSGGNENR
ncbi:uncharacterized protein EV420DRAFT_1484870, partial [Desarmillaria tabescens]